MERRRANRTSRDRRLNSRRPCRTPVRIYTDESPLSESFILIGSDMTDKGVFLHSDYLFTTGDQVELEYMVPGRALPVRGTGKVVRVETERSAMGPGMAVEICGPDA